MCLLYYITFPCTHQERFFDPCASKIAFSQQQGRSIYCSPHESSTTYWQMTSDMCCVECSNYYTVLEDYRRELNLIVSTAGRPVKKMSNQDLLLFLAKNKGTNQAQNWCTWRIDRIYLREIGILGWRGVGDLWKYIGSEGEVLASDENTSEEANGEGTEKRELKSEQDDEEEEHVPPESFVTHNNEPREGTAAAASSPPPPTPLPYLSPPPPPPPPPPSIASPPSSPSPPSPSPASSLVPAPGTPSLRAPIPSPQRGSSARALLRGGLPSRTPSISPARAPYLPRSTDTFNDLPRSANDVLIDYSYWNHRNIHRHPDYDDRYPYALTGHPNDSDWAVDGWHDIEQRQRRVQERQGYLQRLRSSVESCMMRRRQASGPPSAP